MKKFTSLLLCIILALSFAACNLQSKEPAPVEKPVVEEVLNEISGDINIAVEGGSVSALTTEDFKKMEMIEKDLILKKKHGGEENLTLKGVPAKKIIDHICDGYTSIKFVAVDGFENEYDSTIIDAEDSLFAVYSSGKELTEEDGLVWFAAGSQMANKWMKNVAKIVVAK